MKKKLTAFAFALALMLFLCVPSFAADEVGVEMRYVIDTCNLLTIDQWSTLEERAANISERYGCGVYIFTVDDYRNYGNGDVYDVTTQIYHSDRLGIGSGRDGIILLLSMSRRDYALFVYGKSAEYAFNDYGLEQLEDAFLDDFGNNNWSGGFSGYLSECEEYLASARDGHPVRTSPILPIVIAVAASCVIALVVCLILRGGMKTARQKSEAREYVAAGGLHLTRQVDQYTHTTRTSRKIESSSGGSHSHSHSGGGGHGRSGKF